MTVKRAIVIADEFRPNAISEDHKFAWVYQVEAEVAEMMGEEDLPVNPFPDDADLLMPEPYDNIYPLYVVAMIDFYNGETNLFSNDRAMYEEAMSAAKAWYRRNNKPEYEGNWRTM